MAIKYHDCHHPDGLVEDLDQPVVTIPVESVHIDHVVVEYTDDPILILADADTEGV
jgi:hypothetical protein